MQCPSCGHKQSNSLECERCGIIFDKYLKRQERLASERALSEKEGEKPKVKGGIPGLVAGLVIGLLIGGSTFYYFSITTKEASVAAPGEALQHQHGEEVSQRQSRVEGRQKTASFSWQSENGGLDGLARQLAENHPIANSVEGARNATVFIETTWGSGSGFFISQNGLIITNRHVIKMNDKELHKLNSQADKGAKALEREEKTLRYLKSKVSQVDNKEMRQQLKEDIREREQEYAKYKDLHGELLEKLHNMEIASPTDDVKVVLIDGSTYGVDSVMMSERYDLALLSISAYESPYIDTSRVPMEQGQKVYTVGNPHGLRHTVTSGVISGYREYDGNSLIQTDAPINPGNSGGPLIDEEGRVIGVNTMIIRDTEGIGFAIPMKSVFEEFGNYIPQE